MKKGILAIITLLIFLHGFTVSAAPARERAQSRQVLRRTGVLIIAARDSIRIGHNTAGFGLAYSHQLYAKRQFKAGRYQRAMFHSLRARLLAVEVILANKKESRLYDAMYDRLEARYASQAPSEAELDQILSEQGNVWNDRAAIRRIDKAEAY